MKILVVADTHDNLPNIKKVLELAAERSVEAIIHLGDIVSPFAAKPFAASGITTYAVFGNNDGEKEGLRSILDIEKPPRLLELAGKRLLLVHNLGTLGEQEKRGADAVLFGHTHRAGVEKEGQVLMLNPGEAGGWLFGRATCALLDLDAMHAEIVDL